MQLSDTASILARIDKRLDVTGKSDRQASIEGTGSAHTIRNLRKGSMPAVDKMAGLANALGISAAYLAFGVGEERPGAPVSARSMPPIASVRFLGRVSAGAWLDVDTHVDAPLYEGVPVPPDPDYDAADQFFVEVDGNSVNRVAPNGSILGCIDVRKTRRPPAQADLVIVEQFRNFGAEIKRTAKRYHKVEDGIELRPDSDDPKHQTPIFLDTSGEPEEGTSVEVIGIVTWVHAPLKRLDHSRRV